MTPPHARTHKVRPKKHLGQHFLRHHATADRIAQTVACHADVPVLEIGPGTGALTRPLLATGHHRLEVVEIDPESVTHLRNEKWFVESGIRLHAGDMLKWQPSEWAVVGDGGPFALVGNFPYNISGPILFKALELGDRVMELTGMLQKEVAERICAAPGSKTFGILSVLMQSHFHCKYAFTVDEGAFDPPPKVKSGVVQCVRKPLDQTPHHLPAHHLKRVVKAAFNQRRKTLRNALRSAGYDVASVDPAVLGLRAEALSVEGFWALADALPPQGATTTGA